MSKTTPNPEIGRLTITLTAKTIRELRLLAALQDRDQHAIVEEQFQKGGLTAMLEAALNRESARPVQEPSMSRVPTPPMKLSPIKVIVPHPPECQLAPIQVEAEAEELTGATDDDIPW